jgi:hypothetical protein
LFDAGAVLSCRSRRGCAFILAAALGGMVPAAAHAAEAVANTVVSDHGDVRRVETTARSLPDPLRSVPNELLVRFKPGLSAGVAARVLSRRPSASARPMRSVENLYHVRLAPGVTLRQAVRTLRRDQSVLYAEPNFVLEAFAAPNDPSFASQWALRNTGQTGGTAGADIAAVPAWDITTGSPDVAVAVIDTGVDYNHPDLAANVWRNEADCNADGVDDDGDGYVDDCHGIDTVNHDSDPMDDAGHGSHVAGTIGAASNNGAGVTGVNWGVTIVPCKFLNAAGQGDTAGAIACLDYVAVLKDRGLNVVATNNSWGGGLYSQALTDAIRAQQQRGILFVAAAGNAGADNDVVRTYPCSTDLPNVLCVAATDHNDALAGFSNRGHGTVHLGAPGVNILSTTPAGAYQAMSGTSMAAPHVTGVVALLYAQDPSRGWLAVRNRILTGGTPRASLGATLSGRRLNALGALTCSGPPLVARRRPAGTRLVTGIGPIELSVLSLNCGDPVGPVSIRVSPTGETVTLLDDGHGRDQLANDGVFTATWTPPSGGSFDLLFPDGTVHFDVDADLKSGFPVQSFAGAGSYHSGPAIHTLVGNIDGDPGLEILATGLSSGPLYAWKNDGTLAPGWPAADMAGAAYPALGELSASDPGLEVFSAHYGAKPDLSARTGRGLRLPGWPRTSANYVASPPTLADVDGDGIDEIFTEEEDWHLHAYRAGGALLAGWPTSGFVGGQERHTPAVADLDGDGQPEIVTVSGSGSDGVYLFAYHRDGTPLAGFPARFTGYVDTYPVIGDVDGDGQLEIVIVGRVAGRSSALVYSANGTLKRTIPAAGDVGYGTAPALADLSGDGIPEILVQTDTALNVWKGDGSIFPGWPVSLGASTWLKNTSPVVGDVDGDGQPDVVALALNNSSNAGDVLVFHANGTLVGPSFPKHLAGLGSGAVPAIADIDLDGRNDIVVTSDFWNGASGYYDKVWVYSIGGPAPHGAVQWGQFMGGPRHQGLYRPEPVVPALALVVARAGAGEGTVVSDPAGIDCGADCSERYWTGTAVTLTATAAAGSVFSSWDGACAGQGNPCTLTITTDASVTANFDPLFNLTVAVAGSGAGAVSSVPAGIDCGLDCAEAYLGGTDVTLTATPAMGSVFTSWGGACAGQDNPCKLTIASDTSVSANFAPLFDLTVALAGAGAGTVSSVPAGIDCGLDCAEAYLGGTAVTLTAKASADSAFTSWNGPCAGQGNPCTLTMAGDTSVTASFAPLFTLGVAIAAGKGTVTSSPAGIDCGPDCGETFVAGTMVTLTAAPASGYAWFSWEGACAGQGNPCHIAMSASQTVSARFGVPAQLKVTRKGSGHGTVSSKPSGIACGSDCTETYVRGTVVTLTAAPDRSSRFVRWGGSCSGTKTTCTVTLKSDASVTAEFRAR